MATRGKNIHLFLIDGEPRGRIKCTLANWTGVAYKIPRTELDRCKDRKDLKQSGVYFLFGTSDETGKSIVYIGQASIRKNGEGILNRLQEHRRGEDYWTEAVIFTTSNNSFGPTEISYLEHRFCNLAQGADRYDVKNGNDPTPGNITEEKECELEEFIDYAKIVMGTLGHKIFEPLTQTVTDQQEEVKVHPDDTSELFLNRTVKGVGEIKAMGSQTTEGFVVLKGSHISPIDDATVPETVKDRRKKAPIAEDGTLKENLLFTSPSYAAMFVIGKSANGLTSWRDKNKTTLKDLEAKKASN